MSPRREQRALLDRIDIVADAAQQSALIERIIGADRPLTIAFLNQHGFNLYARDAEFRDALREADILLRDGVGISVMMRALGLPAGLNMNGTDFIPQLTRAFIEREPHCGMHAYGTVNPWLELGAKRLFASDDDEEGKSETEKSDSALNLMDGFCASEDYVRNLRVDGAGKKIVVLAMGMPKQEKVAACLKQAASGAAVIVCGGAILDFCADRVPRAPRWVRALRAEWLFRLMLEPRRLFSRYIGGGIKFAMTMIALACEERSLVAKSERESAKAN